jgi:hypothetical protein
MPSIKRVNVTTTTDALNGLKFKVQGRPALVTLFASCVTATDRVSFSVGSQEVLVDASPNIEASADVVDTDRDTILFQERVPPGEYFLQITATTAVNFLLVIDPVS